MSILAINPGADPSSCTIIGSGNPPSAPNNICVSEKAKAGFFKAKKTWSYAGKYLQITRNLLTAAANTKALVLKLGSEFPRNVKKIATNLKMFSICSIVFGFVDLKSTADKVTEFYKKRNFTEVALSTLSFSIISADLCESISSFVNTTLTIFAETTVHALSVVALPLTIYTLAAGATSRCCRIAQSIKALYNNSNESLVGRIKQNLKVDTLGLVAIAVGAVALGMILTATTGPVPYIILAASATIRLGIVYYQDYTNNLKPEESQCLQVVTAGEEEEEIGVA